MFDYMMVYLLTVTAALFTMGAYDNSKDDGEPVSMLLLAVMWPVAFVVFAVSFFFTLLKSLTR